MAAEDEIVDCDRIHAKLTLRSCRGRFVLANPEIVTPYSTPPKPGKANLRRWRLSDGPSHCGECERCPVGAARCGVEAPPGPRGQSARFLRNLGGVETDVSRQERPEVCQVCEQPWTGQYTPTPICTGCIRWAASNGADTEEAKRAFWAIYGKLIRGNCVRCKEEPRTRTLVDAPWFGLGNRCLTAMKSSVRARKAAAGESDLIVSYAEAEMKLRDWGLTEELPVQP